MIHYQWSDTKPEFTEECILIVAQWYDFDKNNPYWEYTLYEIKWQEGVDENEQAAYYYAICCSDGEEWGALDELVANKYFTMPLLK